MTHDHGDAEHDMTRWMEMGPWEERYAGAGRHWSGRPNAVLVQEAAALPSGRALDLGCGEGADVVWLAERGWQVTGADFSSAGLERAAAHATAAGVADRVAWEQADLRTWTPPAAAYDLVTAHFLHLLPDVLAAALPRLAAAVAPGGTLLYVGHHPSDLHTSVRRHGRHDLMPTAEQVAVHLGDGWTIETAEARPRVATDPEGREVTIHDAILRARKA